MLIEKHAPRDARRRARPAPDAAILFPPVFRRNGPFRATGNPGPCRYSSAVRQRLRFAALAVIAAIAFLPGLGRRPIVTSHEARVAQTARQMAVSGWPWRATPVRVAPVQLVK